MSREDELASLLRQTRHAHHAAYIEVDGDDPDWPEWYAGYLGDRLVPILGRWISERELQTMLIELDQRYRQEAPPVSWDKFYAQVMKAEFRPDHQA